MFALQVDLVAAFAVSAIVVFVLSLGAMMLVVYLRRPRTDPAQSHGQHCDIIYVPTTTTTTHTSPDLVKPLLIGFEKLTADVDNSVYPTKELTPLKGGLDEQLQS